MNRRQRQRWPQGAQTRSAIGAVIEALEERRVLSISMEGSVLVLRGTANNDMLTVWARTDEQLLDIDENDVWHTVSLVGVTGIRIEGGDGHDELGAMPLANVFLPMTISGGAGDDTIIGSRGHDVLRGGSGEDDISGSGPVRVDDVPTHWRWGEERVVGGDTLRGSAADDDYAPEAGDDDFHGAAADFASVRYHKGVLYVTGTTGDDQFTVGAWMRGVLNSVNQVRAYVVGSPIDARYHFVYSGWCEQDPTQVRIDGGGGDDRITVGTSGSAQLPLITLSGGGVTQTVGGTGNWVINSAGTLERTTLYGDATLSADGVLTVTGTDAADAIYIGSDVDPNFVLVRVNGWSTSFNLSAVLEIHVYCGAGNDEFDFYNFSTFLHVPVIADGGAGDDTMVGQDDRDMHDNLIRGTRDGITATLIGGEGNDSLASLCGNDHLYGGAGEDVLMRWWKSPDATLDGGEGYDVFYLWDAQTRTLQTVSEFPVDDGNEGQEESSAGTDGGGTTPEPADASDETATTADDVVEAIPTISRISMSGVFRSWLAGDAAGDEEELWA